MASATTTDPGFNPTAIGLPEPVVPACMFAPARGCGDDDGAEFFEDGDMFNGEAVDLGIDFSSKVGLNKSQPSRSKLMRLQKHMLLVMWLHVGILELTVVIMLLDFLFFLRFEFLSVCICKPKLTRLTLFLAIFFIKFLIVCIICTGRCAVLNQVFWCIHLCGGLAIMQTDYRLQICINSNEWNMESLTVVKKWPSHNIIPDEISAQHRGISL